MIAVWWDCRGTDSVSYVILCSCKHILLHASWTTLVGKRLPGVNLPMTTGKPWNLNCVSLPRRPGYVGIPTILSDPPIATLCTKLQSCNILHDLIVNDGTVSHLNVWAQHHQWRVYGLTILLQLVVQQQVRQGTMRPTACQARGQGGLTWLTGTISFSWMRPVTANIGSPLESDLFLSRKSLKQSCWAFWQLQEKHRQIQF